MSAWTCRQFDGKAAQKIVPPRPRIPCWKGLGANSEEKREPVSDIDTAAVDSLKVLDPKRPIREADIPNVSDRCGRAGLRRALKGQSPYRIAAIRNLRSALQPTMCERSFTFAMRCLSARK